MDAFIEQRPAVVSLTRTLTQATAAAISHRGLQQLLASRDLQAWFQPVLDLKSGGVVGYEGLIRGPADNPLHSPTRLFGEAERLGLSSEAEEAARLVVIQQFAELSLPGRLYLNVSPSSLTHPDLRNGKTAQMLASVGLTPQQVVIELTENKPLFEVDGIMEALRHFREAGFALAIDDLGAGFSSLRLWSELLPEYVKVDMHFVQGVHRDPVKYNFLRSVQELAERCGTKLIAEGIELEDELTTVRKLGIAYGQGYLIARPAAAPVLGAPERIKVLLGVTRLQVAQEDSPMYRPRVTAEKLLIQAVPLESSVDNDAVFELFEKHPEQHAIPVTSRGVPIALINRNRFIDSFARPYRRELYGRKSCMRLADTSPLIVDKNMTIHDLSRTLIHSESRHLSEGFIITDEGRYIGLGTGQDLVREITQMQIEAARYANPLTLLPGNVPVDEQTERLLNANMRFVACHCDLDSFKPFNDAYGYSRGDEMIQLSARVLADACDPDCDFLGHVGGDDFILLMQSTDWEARLDAALREFDLAAAKLFDPDDRKADGFQGVDRTGKAMRFPLTTLSAGAVVVEPGTLRSHKEVSAHAGEAKKQAKRMPGSALFLERRSLAQAKPGAPAEAQAQGRG
jgi:EAL domain-containing protein (putative c-di-GMP-specific phosphodiesterase class I)/GGDEF domain-containing protein